MKYELVLFDLDGTLVNTLEAITKTVNSAMVELGLEQYSLKESNNLIGNGVQGIVDKIFEIKKYSESEITKVKMKEIIRKYYMIYFNFNVRLYDNIDKLLDFLSENNIKMGIITNKDQDLAKKTVEENLKKWKFIEIIGSNDEKYPRKPNPYNVNKLSEKFKINKNKILFIGDMKIDIDTAKNSNVDIVYCNWGYGALKNEEGISENIKVNTVDEIIEILK